jgi:fatty acid synthase
MQQAPRAMEDKIDMAEIEKQVTQLFKLRIDVNDLLATEKICKINNVTEGKPVFMVHSIEGIATPLRRLAESLPYPVYCFQCTPTVPHDSIEEMAAFYISLMREIQPTGPYRIVGYSYGAIIGFEVAHQLQSNLGKDSVECAVFIDGSVHYMKTYRKIYRKNYNVVTENLANNPFFEAEILCSLTVRFAPIDYRRMRMEILQQPGWKQRMAIATKAMMDTGLFKSSETVEWACESLISKFLCADKYNPTYKFEGDVSLIRASWEAGAREEDVGRDYGLSTSVTGRCDVHVVDGDHDAIVQGECYMTTSKLLQDIFERKTKE